MKSFAIGAVMACLLGAAAPLSAAPAKVPDAARLKVMSDQQLADEIKASLTQKSPSACVTTTYMEELHQRGHLNAALIWTMHALRGDCLRSEGKLTEALASYKAGESALPEDVEPGTRISMDEDAVRIAAYARSWDDFRLHALHVADRNWPEEFTRLDPEIWNITFWQSRLQDRDAVAMAFAGSSAFGALPEKLRNSFSTSAVKPLLAAGANDKALGMALNRPTPGRLMAQLIDRDFEAIWPQLALAAGPRFSAVLAKTVQRSEAEAKAAPNDEEKLSDLASAYMAARQYDRLVALAGSFDHSARGLGKISEQQAWVLNFTVAAYDQLGRRTEGDALFDQLAALPLEGRGWLVSFVINRAERLVSQERWAEALAAAEKAGEVAARHGNPFAKQIVAAQRYCAAIKLDPARAELTGWWDEIARNWADNVTSSLLAAQCKGDAAAGRRIIADGLANPDTRSTMIEALQPREANFVPDVAAGFVEPRLLLEGQPELQALFARYGRVLPADLMPSGPPVK